VAAAASTAGRPPQYMKGVHVGGGIASGGGHAGEGGGGGCDPGQLLLCPARPCPDCSLGRTSQLPGAPVQVGSGPCVSALCRAAAGTDWEAAHDQAAKSLARHAASTYASASTGGSYSQAPRPMTVMHGGPPVGGPPMGGPPMGGVQPRPMMGMHPPYGGGGMYGGGY